ncbi:hypothetical protein Q4489_17280 [Thalassotalea sp. 1_MG-2023]|uniref:hypothetical protein n=1 Tax=Thalassotalea sp. 1_MG-2023 TaxID=3062680 RepID=UPI0026E46CB3|nr:hypothetical protein [Thalassotalea sp. 1_MG-2023]MDO6428764.1 hypothetical protein [Thalassotalea sp. 1_MG-2023]
MFRFFEKLANLVFPFRAVFLLGTLASAGSFVIVLLFADIATQNNWLTFLLLTFLWCLLLRNLTFCFKPLAQTTDNIGFYAAIKRKLINAIQLIFSLLFIAVSCATIYLSIKLLTL